MKPISSLKAKADNICRAVVVTCTALIYAVFYSFIAAGVGYLSDTLRKLRTARLEIRELTRLLPICAGCKKIRDDGGYRHQLESYLSRHSIAQFSHGLCPECLQASLKEIDESEPVQQESAG